MIMTTNTQRTPDECYDHLDYAEGICPGCKEPVDAYGNTAYDFKYCSFPDCGCDGARLCMAKEGPSDRSNAGNVEGMWSGKTEEQRKAVFDLMGSLK
jgi:hypothetical protein